MNADANWQLLFPSTGTFAEAEYLKFLASRVPADIAKQLERDSSPELSLDEEIDIDDLVRPLSSYKFPTDKLVDIYIVLESAMFGYLVELEEQLPNLDPYKLIYAGSLFLHCAVRGPHHLGGGPFTSTLYMLGSTCISLDFETRIQVGRFLGALLTFLQRDNIGDYAPLSSTLITMSLVFSSIVEQLSTLAEDAMRREDIRKAWVVSKGDDQSSDERAVSDLKNSISEMFGPHGKLLKSADRFLLALGSAEEINGTDDGA